MNEVTTGERDTKVVRCNDPALTEAMGVATRAPGGTFAPAYYFMKDIPLYVNVGLGLVLDIGYI